MKDILEEENMNKSKRLQTKQLSVEKSKRNLHHNPGPSDAKKENSHKRIKVQREKAKKVQYKEHQDDDFDDFEGSDNEVTEDICIICGEFGKNNEMWIRCVMCGQWAHQACSVDGKDEDYLKDEIHSMKIKVDMKKNVITG
ncbi:hypothetical protein RN001_007246 [Aquatica leii]|uniref:Uncharacterized protein n=1 Tax=Aquatica leii TaxID=1421715 RepID=A0AAN7P2J6_9COLE|nr:hypothetical protein RN001_007246 [Aquatica leii]